MNLYKSLVIAVPAVAVASTLGAYTISRAKVARRTSQLLQETEQLSGYDITHNTFLGCFLDAIHEDLQDHRVPKWMKRQVNGRTYSFGKALLGHVVGNDMVQRAEMRMMQEDSGRTERVDLGRWYI